MEHNFYIRTWYSFLVLYDGTNKWRHLIIRIVSILLIYVVLDQILLRVSRLPFPSYSQEFIILNLLERIFFTKYILLLVPVLMLFIFFRKRIVAPWTEFENGRSLRFLVVFSACLLAWMFSTYDFNLYYDQSHVIDRLLLLALVPLICWRPIFIFIFLTFLLAIIWQFEVLPVYSKVDSYLPFRVIILFGAYFLFHVLTKSEQISDFIVLLGSLFAAHYWIPGFGKLSQWWLMNDQVYLLLPANYANGWLAFLEPATISSITNELVKLNWPMKIFTIITECGMLFFFWRRKLAVALLAASILMQLGVFVISGICFWVWMLMDLVLLGLLLSRNHFLKIPVFRKPHLIISMLLIIGSPIWFRPVKLSWFDTPMNYSYRLEVTTATGKSYIIPSDFLAPFNFQFSTSVLNYLSKKPLLPISWGATYDVKTAAWLNDPHIPEQIFNRELNFGRIYYNPEKAALFDSFLHQSLIHWNERLTKDLWLTKLQPPTFHWTFARSPVFATTEPIIRVVVIQVTSYFGNGYYEEIRTTPVYQTAIP